MFKKILIANRGEIALRVIRTCKEMGIATVAVYSKADADSLHVTFADEAVCIGANASKDSYLNVPSLLAAAEITGADAIHPGYGFLAENARFAEICSDSKLKFIGPSADMINRMGNKALAKETMRNCGVPVVPGSEGVVEDVNTAKEIAAQIGYPVILKASAGGGGKGMRVVFEEESIEKAFQTASSEADASFDNAELYLENLLKIRGMSNSKLWETNTETYFTMVSATAQFNDAIKKLIEESPSPILSEEVRQKMGDAAILGAKSINYEGAGTIEFLVDRHLNFYFMEMNTRIQVEHPVTEMINNVDLINQQILVAAGEKIEPVDRKPGGHAFEFRINAEDPDNNFRPSPGKIKNLHFPGGFGVRIDSHIYNEYVIPPFYDSLVAKLIVWGTDRDHCIQRAKRALEEFSLDGIKTTIPFHKKVLENEKFLKGNYDTSFIDLHIQN